MIPIINQIPIFMFPLEAISMPHLLNYSQTKPKN